MEMLEELLKSKLDSRDRQRALKSSKPRKTAVQDGVKRRDVHIDTDPAFAASWTLALLRHPGEENPDLIENFNEFESQIEALKSGDLSRLEETLYSQLLILNGAFTQFITIGMNVAKNGKQANASQIAADFLHLASRYQDQSRKTALAIAELKNPKRTTFVRNQLNQVAIAPPSENTLQLKEIHGSPILDTGAAAAAERTDPELAPLAGINGAGNGRGKATKRQKRA